jgi:MFS family permease
MIPARYRGRVDIAVNGTYWAGAIIGTLVTSLLLHQLAPSIGWRLGFLLGPVLAVFIIIVRRSLPESPRWLLMHGRAAEAEDAIRRIEREALAAGQQLEPVDESKAIEIKPSPRTGYLTLAYVLFRRYWPRSVLGATLMITQSFLYNAIFFTYTLVLTKFYGVKASNAPLYLIVFAVGNLLGPLTIGRLFDTIGRKQMIAGTYIGSGAMLAVTAALFDQHVLTATTQTIAWCVIFFFASAGASSAYLTVSEVFPLEVRAQAIAVFFAIAQCFGALGPVLYGHLIGNGANTTDIFIGYLIAAGAMVLGGIVEIVLGVAAEGKSLEDIADPLSMVRRPVESESGITSGSAGQVWRPNRTDWKPGWLPTTHRRLAPRAGLPARRTRPVTAASGRDQQAVLHPGYSRRCRGRRRGSRGLMQRVDMPVERCRVIGDFNFNVPRVHLCLASERVRDLGLDRVRAGGRGHRDVVGDANDPADVADHALGFTALVVVVHLTLQRHPACLNPRTYLPLGNLRI